MNYITLISDWKLRDPYISFLKSDLNCRFPDLMIYDITHAIELFMINQAAFILKNNYTHFPEQTIHLILVGNTFNPQCSPVVVKCNNHYFLGEDTGVFSLMFQNEKYESMQYKDGIEKPFMDKIYEMIEWIFQGKMKENLLTDCPLIFRPIDKAFYSKETKTLKGTISYIDSCCNAVTNIPVELFLKTIKNRAFEAVVSDENNCKIKKFHNCYKPTETDLYLVSNRMGFIEITMYQGNIAALANLNVGDSIKIQII